MTYYVCIVNKIAQERKTKTNNDFQEPRLDQLIFFGVNLLIQVVNISVRFIRVKLVRGEILKVTFKVCYTARLFT